jgi:hypothetical protein
MLHAACVLADYAGTMEVSNRTEVRGRVTPGLAQGAEGVDLADIPAARFDLSDRRWRYTLGYRATAMLPDLELGVTPELINSADIGAAWHDRSVEIGLAESATYGQYNTGQSLAGATPVATTGGTMAPPTTGVQALAPPGTLTFGSSLTDLVGRYQLARRWHATTDLDYSITGGLDDASRAFLPLVRGPRAELRLGHDVTRIDTLETVAIGQHADTSSGQCFSIIVRANLSLPCQPSVSAVQLLEVWRHRFGHDTEGAFGAGASYAHVDLGAGQPYASSIYPAAQAGLLHRRTVEGLRSVARFDVALAPFLDLRTGVIDERAQATLGLELPSKHVGYTATVGAARSVVSSLTAPATIVQASVDVEWHLTRVLSVGSGLRFFWQQQDPLGTYAGAMLVGFLTIKAPVTKF